MKKLIITRSIKTKFSVGGNLKLVDSDFSCETLERPDLNNDGIKNNEKGQSCIPTGTYVCKRRNTEIVKRSFASFNIKPENEKVAEVIKALKETGTTFEITGVPGRSAILFHPANFAYELQGCVAVGKGCYDCKNILSLINSRQTFLHLSLVLWGENEVELEVKEHDRIICR